MPLVSFGEMMTEAEQGQYAVGYFESWNLESLLAVADAAEAQRSPVILGYSGIYLPHPERLVKERLGVYAALGLETCRHLAVPVCLLFNESDQLDWVFDAIDQGFNLVMFTDESLDLEEQTRRTAQVVEKAHAQSVAVEGEITSLLPEVIDDAPGVTLDDPVVARDFVKRTGVDALAVSVGQAHVHGREQVRLNLSRLQELREAVPVPLVLHGATSVFPADMVEAIRLGIRKINVGSVLKRTYFEAMRDASVQAGDDYDPYHVIGSGMDGDVLTVARVDLQRTVEDLMRLYGSAGKAV